MTYQLTVHCILWRYSLNLVQLFHAVIFCQVPGVGFDNSLKITMNSTITGKKVRYRIFISEVGTTVSKVFFDIDPQYQGHQTFHIHGIHYVQVWSFPRFFIIIWIIFIRLLKNLRLGMKTTKFAIFLIKRNWNTSTHIFKIIVKESVPGTSK